MRKEYEPQRSIFEFTTDLTDHSMVQRLRAVSEMLDAHPEFLDWIAKDLRLPDTQNTGREGLTAENVLRAGILKQRTGLSYEDLAFFIVDSNSFRHFVRIWDWEPCSSTLQAGIGKIKPETWEAIHQEIVWDAEEEGIEEGRVTRTDSTVVESNIHQPTDSSLLWDAVRVMVRLLESGPRLKFRDHRRVAKKTAYALDYESRNKDRKPLYKKLIRYAKKTAGYLAQGVCSVTATDPETIGWVEESKRMLFLVQQIIDQAERRVIKGEQVPEDEKLYSLFETHTDLIIKGHREMQWGHKINLTSGKSGLIIDAVIEVGNPADASRAYEMVKRQHMIYGQPPRQTSFDGCYASKDNLQKIKDLGVEDVMFHKKRGLDIDKMASSAWVYRKLRNFRAGIEGNISALKRRYGLYRCTWKGDARFHSYTWSSILSYNLFLLADLKLKTA